MRLIDADALIDKCGGWYVDECTESGFIGTLENILATEPTIQPEKAQLSKEGTTKDAIDRQAAIDAFEDTTFTKNEIRRRLSELPPAQPERKKGTWINEGGIVRCNKCKIGYATVKGMKSALTYNFCPNCGADMGGEQDDSF